MAVAEKDYGAVYEGRTRALIHVAVTGGGSAGHVIPALAVADDLAAGDVKISYIGEVGGIEQTLVAETDYPFFGISAGKLRRYFSWRNVTDVWRVVLGIWQAWRLLGRLGADAVFSKGGFVSFPVVFAGWLRRIPVVAHESDFSPGLANRLGQRFTQTLCTSFAQTRVPRTQVVHTGSPIRRSLLEGDARAAAETFQLEAGKPLVLVTGGSLGAETLNQVVVEALPQLTAFAQVVHVCGSGKALPEAQPGYRPLTFVDAGWGDLLAAADVVVSRAGANALFELLALGKPNVLVPLTAAASRGDQLENAAFAEEMGYSLVVQESDLSVASLVTAVETVLAERTKFGEALAAFELRDATAQIGEIVLAAAKKEPLRRHSS